MYDPHSLDFIRYGIAKAVGLYQNKRSFTPVGIPKLLLPRPKPFATFPRTKRGRDLGLISAGIN